MPGMSVPARASRSQAPVVRQPEGGPRRLCVEALDRGSCHALHALLPVIRTGRP